MFHVKRDADRLVAGLGDEQLERLRVYEALLRDRAVPLGLVAAGDARRLRERHVLDALRCLPCLRETDRDLADLGSGAGLPGVPVAIARPTTRVTLIESLQRRAAFLELAVEELGLRNAVVVIARLGKSPPAALLGAFDVCLARALADPGRSWRLALPLLREGGRLLYFAGEHAWPHPPGAGEDLSAVRGESPDWGDVVPEMEICEGSRFQGQSAVVIMHRADGF